MKKIILTLMLILAGACAFAYNYNPYVKDAINENQIVDYSPVTKKWSRNLKVNDYVFSKHMTHGSGGFSEYTFKDKTYDSNTTYEFLYNGRLIGYNVHLLKFFDLGLDKDGFTYRELTPDEVQRLFPYVQLVKISDFKDGKITLDLPIFHTQTFMLLNDTDREFYKYSFEYFNNDKQLFRSVFEIRVPRILVYSHFKSRNPDTPALEILIKPFFHIDEN